MHCTGRTKMILCYSGRVGTISIEKPNVKVRRPAQLDFRIGHTKTQCKFLKSADMDLICRMTMDSVYLRCVETKSIENHQKNIRRPAQRHA